MTKGNKSNNDKTAAKQNKQKNKVSDEILEKAAEVYFFYQDNPEYSDVMLQLAFEPPYKNKSFVQWVTPLKDGTTLWDKMQKEMDRRLKDPIARAAAEKFTSRIVSNELKDQAVATRKREDNNSTNAIYEYEKGLPQISFKGKGASLSEYPVDKVNTYIWTLLINAEKNGQLTFAAERSGSKKTADIIYSINFDNLATAGLNTKKRLTVFDKRVLIAANALYNSTGEIMTVSQIYETMGNDNRPNKREIERIYTSLEKMRLIPISLDNTSEHELYPNIEKFIYNGVILPWDSMDAIINGQRVDGAIRLFIEPPLITFAKSRKQVTTIPRKLLASPINKTEMHLLIDDYLIERISRLKNGHAKLSNKLLYATIYEKAGITGRMQKNRAKETVLKYLEHYKKCGFINDYKETTDGVNIFY